MLFEERRRLLYVMGKRANVIFVVFVFVLAPLFVSTALGKFKLECESLRHRMSDQVSTLPSGMSTTNWISLNFTSYRLLRDESLSLVPNRPSAINAHEGVSLEITLTKQQKRQPCTRFES